MALTDRFSSVPDLSTLKMEQVGKNHIRTTVEFNAHIHFAHADNSHASGGLAGVGAMLKAGLANVMGNAGNAAMEKLFHDGMRASAEIMWERQLDAHGQPRKDAAGHDIWLIRAEHLEPRH